MTSVNTLKLISDAAAFMRRFMGGACSHSTPHIYISALPFWDKSSTVYGNYWTHTQGLIDVKGSAMKQWHSPGIGVWSTNSSVQSVAFSPDGTRIVSGSSDHTIQVWDSHTGDIVAGPLQGHTDSVKSVAFSSDGTRIVSGSSDCTIQVWDSHTGDIVAGPFQGHTDSVNSVAFSSDGTCIVSGSSDHTIRVTDYCTITKPHIFNHSSLLISDFTYNQDGWITAGNIPLFWIFPGFQNQLPFPHDCFVIGHDGSSFINYQQDIYIGEAWFHCYIR